MFRKILVLGTVLSSITMYAQRDKDDVEYYTDSRVKQSRFSIALMGSPNYTDRRLINDEIPAGGGFDLTDENAKGAFQFNYNLDVFFSIGSALDIGLGFGRATADYNVQDVSYYEGRTDTVLSDVDVNVGMYTLPLKLNFNTSVTDILDLEVVPMVELNFVDRYRQDFHPEGEASFTRDLSDEVQSLNYSVGISLGGTFHLDENWGIIVRGNIKYMLNPLIEKPNFPRETLYSYGANVGIKYKF